METKPREGSFGPGAERLPDELVLGVAAAATQIEGGDTNNSWYRWAASGHTRDGSTPLVACDHWNRIAADVELLVRLGVGGYRLGVEWSRLEPSPGRFDEAALERYRTEIELLVKAGIRPLVTLHHFSNPLWLEDSGGWFRPDIAEIFGRYVRRVSEALGDLVTDWITINEPNIYLYFGYVKGEWPPGRLGDISAYLRGRLSIARAHAAAYRILHDGRLSSRGVRVGVAHHLRIFEAATGSPLELVVASLYRRLNQGWFLDHFTVDEGGRLCADFLGINYYSRDMVHLSADAGHLFGRLAVKPQAATSDLGWEIYPKGLGRLCRDLHRRFGEGSAFARRHGLPRGLPLVVTENGVCDAEDRLREGFIVDHLREIRRLAEEGIAIGGYYHWTLMDNFEWAEGLSAPFGLYRADFRTQERLPRPSAELYARICRTRTLPPPGRT